MMNQYQTEKKIDRETIKVLLELHSTMKIVSKVLNQHHKQIVELERRLKCLESIKTKK